MPILTGGGLADKLPGELAGGALMVWSAASLVACLAVRGETSAGVGGWMADSVEGGMGGMI